MTEKEFPELEDEATNFLSRLKDSGQGGGALVKRLQAKWKGRDKTPVREKCTYSRKVPLQSRTTKALASKLLQRGVQKYRWSSSYASGPVKRKKKMKKHKRQISAYRALVARRRAYALSPSRWCMYTWMSVEPASGETRVF